MRQRSFTYVGILQIYQQLFFCKDLEVNTKHSQICMLMCVAKCQAKRLMHHEQRRRALIHIITEQKNHRRRHLSYSYLPIHLTAKASSFTALSQETSTTMSTSSTHQLATNEGDIPFILLTPTKKATEDAEGDTTADDDDDDVEESPLQISFFLKPRRSCHKYKYSHSCGSSPEMDAKPSSDAEEMHGCESTSVDKTVMDHLCSYSSPRKSPVPTLNTSFDVMLTPPRINLLKRRRHGSQEQQAQAEEDDTGSSSKANGPLFPVLNLKHHEQKQQPNLCRPIPRRRR